MAVGVCWLDGECLAIRLARIFVPTHIVQHVGAVVVRLEKVRRQVRGLLVQCQRLRQVPPRVVEIAEIDEGGDKKRIDEERASIEVGGAF